MSLYRYKELTAQYDIFTYESYQVEKSEERLMLNFQYKITGKKVQPIIFNHRVGYEFISKDKKKLNLDLIKDLDTVIFSIGLVESINYYKTICPKVFHIACGHLTKEQENWWSKLFYHGLGEFIYLNGLAEEVTEKTLVRFTSEEYLPNTHEEIHLDLTGNLIPIGGGKDSVVSLELLKGEKEENLCFVMSPPKAAYDCIEVAGYDEYLLAERYLDKQIIVMNNNGYMNGHIPFSAILGFISVLGAALTGKKYIVLSNEGSANESTVIGESFNHQYSKSYDFEIDLNTYVKKYLIDNMNYFSLLRGMYELEIADRFAKLSKYHSVFRSCNRGKKDNIWCGKCSKCLFVYIILGPFLSEKELINIFGSNLLEDEELVSIFQELIGIKETKPFECVGTVDEIRFAMKKIIESYKVGNILLPVLAKEFIDKIDIENIGKLNDEIYKTNIPDVYKARLEVLQ